MPESLEKLSPIGSIEASTPGREHGSLNSNAGRTGNGTGVSLAHLTVSPEALRALPGDFVKRNRILPYRIEDGRLYVATAQPGNQRLIEDIRLLSALEVNEAEAPADQVLEKIAECY